MSTTPVYIICSPRPMVGKTLLARLLSEFLLLKDGAVSAFDINLKEPSLLEYLPRVTETADIADTFGKMQLMDRLIVHDGVAKVVDLGFHAFDEFFRMTNEIGFLKEAVRRGAHAIATICPLCQFNLDAYHDRIEPRWGPVRIAAVYITQLMGLAFGLPAEQLGLQRNFVPLPPLPVEPDRSEPAVAAVGAVQP